MEIESLQANVQMTDGARPVSKAAAVFTALAAGIGSVGSWRSTCSLPP